MHDYNENLKQREDEKFDKIIRFLKKVLKFHKKNGTRSFLACATGGLLHIIKAGDHTIAETRFKISIKNQKGYNSLLVFQCSVMHRFIFLSRKRLIHFDFFAQYKKNMYVHCAVNIQVSRTNEQKVFRSVHTVEDRVIMYSPV
jgi:hypothetical protein